MMMKTLNTALNLLMTFVVWLAVAMLAIVTFHLLAMGAFTVYHLLQS